MLCVFVASSLITVALVFKGVEYLINDHKYGDISWGSYSFCLNCDKANSDYYCDNCGHTERYQKIMRRKNKVWEKRKSRRLDDKE